ncbi:Degenerin mec-4 like protein [Argiope bruennichi]|uniref:Degenerin mec-4 like protein n=1 Tax=Argiope bruennichi TaxID=94029 RepID=A0A8T0G0Y6_ARGBR|nr:Degenerin mec-4 like protein [Argiope bruennichi]
MWTLALAIAFIGWSYHIFSFTNLYFEYPVVVNLQKEERSREYFPAVTICNLNRMKLDSEIGVNSSMYQNSDDELSISYLIESEKRSLSKRNQNDSKTQQYFLANYFKLSPEIRQIFGYHFNEVVISCSFNFKPCKFRHNLNIHYGNCFTFDGVNGNFKDPLTSKSVGLNNGLEMILKVDPKDIHRLPFPYKDKCVLYGSKEQPVARSRKPCTESYIQEFNFAACDCVEPTFWTTPKYKHCDTANSTQATCLDNLINDLAVEGTNCQYPPACVSIVYDEQITKALWPSKAYFFKRHNHSENFFKRYRKSHSKVRIFFSNLEKSKYEQKAKFQTPELLSCLGGEIGLWLGISFLKEIHRLPFPYKDKCVLYGSEEQPLARSRKQCTESCIQEFNFTACDYIEPTFWTTAKYKHCDRANSTQATCLDNLIKDLAVEGTNCQYPPACVSIFYDEQITKALWPSKAYFFKKHNHSESFFKKYRKSHAKVRILFSNLEKSKYEQKANFQIPEYLSCLGGEIGFWLGISLLVLSEIMEAILFIISCMIDNIKKCVYFWGKIPQ